MEALPLVVSSVLTSTVVSSIAAAVLKYRFDKRVLQLQHEFEVSRLEANRKYEEERAAAAQREEQRRITFPKIVTKVYRVRNAAREVRDQALRRPVDASKLQNAMTSYQSEQAGLEELLYELRLYLETERFFVALHEYKRTSEGLFGHASAILAAESGDSSAYSRAYRINPNRVHGMFEAAYDEIDRRQLQLINDIAEAIARNHGRPHRGRRAP